MKIIYKTTVLGILLLAFANGDNLYGQATQIFGYTGSVQTFTVPQCVNFISVDARGGEGANAIDKLQNNSTGGLGGRAQGILTVTPGQVLNIYVGGMGNTNGNGGFNGGGIGGMSTAGGACNGGPAGGGGGASDIRTNGTSLSNRVIVAAGGGGSGRDYCNGTCQPCGCGGSGGHGGGLTGGFGQAANNCGFQYPGNGTNGGAPGSPTAGGAGGAGDNGGTNGTSGSIGLGGDGALGSYDVSGGGGGGGYYGGGGGGSASSGSGVGGGGGGGGSSYIAGLTGASTTQSFQTGNGQIVLNYTVGVIVNISTTYPAVCLGSSITLSAPSLASYTWSNGSNASSILVGPTANTNYSVSGTTTLGCPANGIITVSVSSGPPVLSVTSSTNQTCLGKTVTLTATGALTYTWTGGPTNGVSFMPTATNSYTVSGQNGCGTSTAVTTVTVAPLPVTAISSPTIVCAGQPATLTAVSAATGYTWMPSPAPNAASFVVNPTTTTYYTVSVSDGTCSGVANVSITANPIPTISIVASASLVCQGDPVIMTASGGINYTWTPGNLPGTTVTVTPTGPTLYSVIGDNSVACTSSTTQIVLTSPSPTVGITASSTFVCAGDQVNLLATGANTYSWDNGATTAATAVTPTLTTIYSVIGFSTNNICTTTKTIMVTVFEPVFIVTASSASICSGSTVTLSATGADAYSWNDGSQSSDITVSPISNTFYIVTASTFSNGVTCSASKTIQVTVNPKPIVTAISTRTAICKGEKTNLTAGGASTYIWSTGGTSSVITVSPTAITTVNYSVTGTDANGCKNTANILVKVSGCTGINDPSITDSHLTVYPNPSKSEFVIAYDKEVTLILSNELGQLVKTVVLTADNNYKTTVKGLASGIYFIGVEKGPNLLNVKIAVE